MNWPVPARPVAWGPLVRFTFAVLAAVAAQGRGVAAPGAEEARDLPKVEFTATVSNEPGTDEPRLVTGHVRITNWNTADGQRCLYLPYEDPYFGEWNGTARRFEALAQRIGHLGYLGGMQSLAPNPPTVMGAGKPPHVVPVTATGPDGAINFDFVAKEPRLPSSDAHHWVHDGFLPELLRTCPPSGLDPLYYRRPLAANFNGTIKLPSSWEYGGPGTLRGDTVMIDRSGRTVAFALGRNFTRINFSAGEVPVTLLFHKHPSEELATLVQAVLPELERMFGPYPYKTLTIVESSELQRHGLPGLIVMNVPHQWFFERLQKSWLNWQHWILAIQLAHQWFGGAVTAVTPDDDWLIDGIADFGTLEALSHDAAHYDLFNKLDSGGRILTFNYLQAAELTAATLQYGSPLSFVTNADMTTHDPEPRQDPVLFIKHAMAMRQLKSLAGEKSFYGFLRGMTARHLNGELKPSGFAEELTQLPSPFPPPVRTALADDLLRWWTHTGWPDFALTSFTSDPLPDGRWASHVTTHQVGQIDFAPMIGVVDDSDKTFVARATQDGGKPGDWKATIITQYKPRSANIDPEHEAFDADRFNNSSEFPGLSVFPGPADTLKDDAYTLLWLPYAFKHPGEPFSIGIQAAVFRYLQSGLLAHIGYATSTHRGEFDISHTFNMSEYALSSSVDASSDYYGARQAEAVLQRLPVLPFGPNIGLQVRLRQKEQGDDPQTSHTTGVIGATMMPLGVVRTCGYNLAAQYEKAPRELAHGFEYDRSLGTASLDCYLTPRSSVVLRAFRGVLSGDGNVPDLALFKPNDLHEARLRIDNTVPWVRSLDTGGIDLLLPFYAPIPNDAMILSRQMRWRLFYDAGYAVNENINLRDGGVGFQLPFGGDLSGAGSLALTRFSFLTVLYQQVGQTVSRKPTILFDLTGDL